MIAILLFTPFAVPPITESADLPDPVIATDHDIDLILRPERGEIQVTDQITLSHSLTDNHYLFFLSSRLSILTLSVSGKPARFEMNADFPSHRGKAYRVALPPAPATGKRKLSVFYSGALGYSQEFGSADPETRGRTSWLGQPDSLWLPLDSGPGYTFRLRVQTPATWIPVSSRQFTTSHQGRERSTWACASDQGTRSLTIAAGRFEHEIREAENSIHLYYVKPGPEKAGGIFDKAEGLISRFQDRLGPLPDRTFQIVLLPGTRGMAEPAFAVLSRMETNMADSSRHLTLAHAIAAAWFGDYFRAPAAENDWISGLVDCLVFSDQTTSERFPGAGVAFRKEACKTVTIDSCRDQTMQVQIPTDPNADSISVARARYTMAFHHLQQITGEEKFYSVLRALLHERAPGELTLADLITAYRNTDTECFLFPCSWFQEPYALRLSLAECMVKRNDAYFSLTGKINQEPPFLQTNCNIEIRMGEGALTQQIPLAGSETEFTLPLTTWPSEVILDPQYDLLRLLLEDEMTPLSTTCAASGRVRRIPSFQHDKQELDESLRKAIDAITPAIIMNSLQQLSQTEFAGRSTGSLAEERTRHWVCRRWEKLGFEAPFLDSGEMYTQPCSVELRHVHSPILRVDTRSRQSFRPPLPGEIVPFPQSPEVNLSEVPLLFTGDLSSAVPENENPSAEGHRDSVLLVLRNHENYQLTDTAMALARAREVGATALLLGDIGHRMPFGDLPTPPSNALVQSSLNDRGEDPAAGFYPPGWWGEQRLHTPLPACHIGNRIVEQLLRIIQDPRTGPGQILNPGNSESPRISLSISTDRMTVRSANLIASIPPQASDATDEWIVIGCHLDQWPRGAALPARAGVDPDGESISVLTEIGRAFHAVRPKLKRGILLTVFTGGEQEHTGAVRFLESPPVPLQRMIAMLNLEAVGRGSRDCLAMIGAKSSPDLFALADQYTAGVQMNLKPASLDFEIPGSDHTPFRQQGIPAVTFHGYANRASILPPDRNPPVNPGKAAQVARAIILLAFDLASSHYLPVPPENSLQISPIGANQLSSQALVECDPETGIRNR